MRIAVLSDTHGLLRPSILPYLQGVDHILHAGDVGDNRILETLRAVAPTTAIRGNIDTYGETAALPATEAIELAGHFIYMLHAIDDLDLRPEAASFSVVVYGHSHRPQMETRHGVLYLNPGSCGPKRFSLPISMAMLTLEPAVPPEAHLIELEG